MKNNLLSFQKRGIKNPSYKHGGKGTRLYKIWDCMKQRCFNPKSMGYEYWGGRGILVCPEWTNDYVAFRDWSLSNGYQEGLEIDRRDISGNYEPNNCRFVTKQENSQNRRTTKLSKEKIIEIREKHKPYKYSAKRLSFEYDVSVGTIFRILSF